MKHVLALDIGITTGTVVAAAAHREVPQIVTSRHIRLHDQAGEDGLWTDLKPVLDNHRIDLIILEFPIHDSRSDNAHAVARCIQLWERVLQRMEHYLVYSPEVVRIAPSQWKGTPSKSVNVFSYRKNVALARHQVISRHEHDAANMIHWASFYGRLIH